jgi:hypothetical protein
MEIKKVDSPEKERLFSELGSIKKDLLQKYWSDHEAHARKDAGAFMNGVLDDLRFNGGLRELTRTQYINELYRGPYIFGNINGHVGEPYEKYLDSISDLRDNKLERGFLSSLYAVLACTKNHAQPRRENITEFEGSDEAQEQITQLRRDNIFITSFLGDSHQWLLEQMKEMPSNFQQRALEYVSDFLPNTHYWQDVIERLSPGRLARFANDQFYGHDKQARLLLKEALSKNKD